MMLETEVEKMKWMMMKRGDDGGVEITLGPGKIVPDVLTEILSRCQGKPVLGWLEMSKNTVEIESPEDIPYEELRKVSSYFGPVLHFKASLRDTIHLWRYIDSEELPEYAPELLEGDDEELAKELEDKLLLLETEPLRFKGLEAG
ncbi:MAG: hypothetical protein V3U51_00145 [Thermoplasmata archaeon]